MRDGLYVKRALEPYVLEGHRYYSVTVVSGPRQVGKTTMCRHLFPDYKYYNLEDIALRQHVLADPKGFLRSCAPGVIIDEAQLAPELFSYLMVFVDEHPEYRFILTGSSNYLLLQGVSQSLAGRAALFTVLPFSISELQEAGIDRTTDELLLNGFFPGTVVKGLPARMFFDNYVSTYIERDVRQIKNVSNLLDFQSVIKLFAARAGTELNASSITSQTGISSPTVKSWLGILETSYLAFLLPPYTGNIGKRIIKTPKIYFADCGLLCSMLGISTVEQLMVHPLKGAVFENMVVMEFFKNRYNAAQRPNLYFYREASSYEVDLLQEISYNQLDAYEIKSSATYNPAFMKNLNYLKTQFGSKLNSASLIYSGETMPPDIFNYKEFFKNTGDNSL